MTERWITIGGEVLAMRYNFAGLYLFEEVAGSEFNANKIMHQHLLIWCMLKVNNDGFKLSFDEFVELMNGDVEMAYVIEKTSGEMVMERADLLESVKRSSDGGAEKKAGPEADGA